MRFFRSLIEQSLERTREATLGSWVSITQACVVT